MSRYSASEPGTHGIAGGARIPCAAWLLAGFIGASAVAGGLVQLLDGAATPLPALILALCGATLAATGWQRADAILDRGERATPIVGASSATSAGA